jgi:predicted ATPase/transcriptional regulator with XRE-family HTH domain
MGANASDRRSQSFGALLRRYRGARGLTQEELAERSGLSGHAISMLERGVRRAPYASTVECLAEALKLNAPQREAFVAARAPTQPDALILQASPDLRLPPTGLIGRDRELTQVGAMLAQPGVRLLTLTGSPGTGKTRLALGLTTELADRYRDGVTVVTLGPLGDPGLVMPAIRQALGLRETANQSALETVAAHCRSLHLLLVLDNFEHLVAAAPDLVELLARCPDLWALVTSRAALRVRGEHELPLPPLEVPGADQERTADPEAMRRVASVRLFLERAEAAMASFRLTEENAPAVAAICRRLDGLPLALELAAPWLKLLTPDQLLARLDHRLELLVEGPRDLPERQRTLRAALDWSCDLLDEEARALLRRLSVFASSAPLEEMESVCQAAGSLPGGVLPHLGALVEHSLVQRQEAARGEPRMTMLESVREYAREELEAAGELEVTARAHLEHYSRLAARARGEIRGPGQASWLERLRREHDNVRAALAWAGKRGDTEAGLRLATALCPFWDYTGHRSEGLDWLEHLLATTRPVDPATRARGLTTAGYLSWRLGRGHLSATRYREALAIFTELDDLLGTANALYGMGLAAGCLGDDGEAAVLLEKAVSLLRELDDRALLAAALGDLGVVMTHRGDSRRAAALFEGALGIQRELDNQLGAALCLVNLGEHAASGGDLELARARIEEATATARRLGAPFHLAAALSTLGHVARLQGDGAAVGNVRESLLLFVQIGDAHGAAACLRALALAAWMAGLAVPAARLYGAADAQAPMAAPAERAVHETALAAVRGHLGEERFAAAHEAGGRLSMEQAVAEATAPG